MRGFSRTSGRTIAPSINHEMRILVVEDERTLAGFVEQSLRAEGHAVTVASDGETGQARALTGDYALVLLDLTLPAGTGSRCSKRSGHGFPTCR